MIATVLAAALLLQSPQATAQSVEVAFDPRVELLCILARLAGNPEFQQAPAGEYVKAVDAHFSKFASHPAVGAMIELRKQYGISYNAVPAIAVYLDSLEKLEPIAQLDPLPEGLDGRWEKPNKAEFFEKLRAFAKETKAAEFFASHKSMWDKVEAVVRAAADKEAPIPWFDGFFGARPGARFRLVPSILSGTHNFGAPAKPASGPEILYQVLGFPNLDRNGLPSLDRGFAPLLVHEMAHAYCNPLIDRFYSDLRDPGHDLFEAKQQEMSRQAYPSGRIVLYESFVRACTVLYALERHGESNAAAVLGDQEQQGFVWTLDLVRALQAIRKNPPKSGRMADAMLDFGTAIHEAAKKDWGAFRSPFRGPFNSIFTSGFPGAEILLAGPSDAPKLSAYLDAIVPAIAKKFKIRREELPKLSAEAMGKHPVLLYGSPESNPHLKKAADQYGWVIEKSGITLGGRRFDGENLVLIACRPSPGNPTVAVGIYASADPENLVGINGLTHGVDDWLVGRRIGSNRFEPVARGSFPKRLDGSWDKLDGK